MTEGVYSVRLELESDGLFYVSVWAGDVMVTSWRTRSLSDAMFDAGIELRTVFGEDVY
jgi:hypothetical protein